MPSDSSHPRMLQYFQLLTSPEHSNPALNRSSSVYSLVHNSLSILTNMSMEPAEVEVVEVEVEVAVVAHSRMTNTLGHRMESMAQGTSSVPEQPGEGLVVS